MICLRPWIRIAGSEFSLYCFEGLKAKGNYEALHITGTNFDDPECLELTVKSRIVLAIHGFNDENKVVYAGGRNENLKVQIIEVLKGAGFRAEEDVATIQVVILATSVTEEYRMEASNWRFPKDCG
jgi:phage replication-related protein YjqB (UPF0714/DUF867 family)